MKLEGKIQDGRLLVDPAILAIAMRDCGDGPVVLEINRKRRARSIPANRRHWGLLVYLTRHHLNLQREKAGELPLSKEQVHYALAAAFVGCEPTELGPVPMPTRVLDSAQFNLFKERVELWLREKGYPIPDGSDADVEAIIAEAS